MHEYDNGKKAKWFKGKSAETIAEELFHDCEYDVFRMGYESILKNLAQLRDRKFNRESPTAKIILSIPDFVVVNQKGEPFIIEVKYRSYKKGRYWFGETESKELESVLNRWNALVVLITDEKPYFRIIDKHMIAERKSIPLHEYEKLAIPVDRINRYGVCVESMIIHASKEIMNGANR